LPAVRESFKLGTKLIPLIFDVLLAFDLGSFPLSDRRWFHPILKHIASWNRPLKLIHSTFRVLETSELALTGP
jgi:hypothetical protein